MVKTHLQVQNSWDETLRTSTICNGVKTEYLDHYDCWSVMKGGLHICICTSWGILNPEPFNGAFIYLRNWSYVAQWTQCKLYKIKLILMSDRFWSISNLDLKQLLWKFEMNNKKLLLKHIDSSYLQLASHIIVYITLFCQFTWNSLTQNIRCWLDFWMNPILNLVLTSLMLENKSKPKAWIQEERMIHMTWFERSV